MARVHLPYVDRSPLYDTIPEEDEDRVLDETTEAETTETETTETDGGREEDDIEDDQTTTAHDSSDEDGAAPAPIVWGTRARPQELSTFYNNSKTNNNSKVQNPPPNLGQGTTMTYKPYEESVTSRMDSDASSILSSTVTEDLTGDEASSIAESADTNYSSASDFAFDGRLGWNPRGNASQAERERQRWANPAVAARQVAPQVTTPTQTSTASSPFSPLSPLNSNSTTVTGSSIERRPSVLSARNEKIPVMDEEGGPLQPPPRKNSTQRTSPHTLLPADQMLPPTLRRNSPSTMSISTTTSSKPEIPLRMAQIVKRTSFDQRSIHIPDDEAERSGGINAIGGFGFGDLGFGHHYVHGSGRASSLGDNLSTTRSISTSERSGSSSGEWQSSDCDVSGLSADKIARLRKKGVNPALYAEMKAARAKGGKKKSFISPLTGNTFLG